MNKEELEKAYLELQDQVKKQADDLKAYSIREEELKQKLKENESEITRLIGHNNELFRRVVHHEPQENLSQSKEVEEVEENKTWEEIAREEFKLPENLPFTL